MISRWRYRNRTALYLNLLLGVGIFVLGGQLIDWFNPGAEERSQNRYYRYWTADPDSSSARRAGHWPSVPPIEDIAIDGQTVCLGSGSGLKIVNASKPKRPHLEGRIKLSGPVADVDLKGKRAYVITNHIPLAGTPYRTEEFGLKVVDISVPTAPKEVGGFKTSGTAREVTVTRGFAFIADGRDGLRVVDITASDFLEVSFFSPSSNAVAVAASEEHVYLADGPNGLWVIGAALPSEALHKLGRYNPAGYVSDVAVAGDYAFVAVSGHPAASGGTGDVRVVDISDPRSPREVGTFGVAGQPGNIAINGDRAYTPVRGVLQVFNISTPGSPRRIGAFKPKAGGRGVEGEEAAIGTEVAVSDQHVYFANGKYPPGLHVFDVSASADGERHGQSEKR